MQYYSRWCNTIRDAIVLEVVVHTQNQTLGNSHFIQGILNMNLSVRKRGRPSERQIYVSARASVRSRRRDDRALEHGCVPRRCRRDCLTVQRPRRVGRGASERQRRQSWMWCERLLSQTADAPMVRTLRASRFRPHERELRFLYDLGGSANILINHK